MAHYRLEQKELKELSDAERQAVLEFLEERYRDYFEREYRVLLVWSDSSLCGVVFSRVLEFEKILEVPIFFLNAVESDLIIQILEHLDAEVQTSGCEGILLIYKGGGDFEPLLEELLEQRGWHDPEYHKVCCLFASQNFNAPWLTYPYKLPADYEIFLWKDLKKAERERLKELEGRDIFPHSVSPLKKEERIEPLNSLGLRKEGAVIGWVITHRPDPDMIQYVSFWTLRGHRAFGPSVKMLADSIRIHIDAKILWGEAEANYNQVDHRWVQFFQKRLIPYSEKVTYLYRVFKPL